jgi:hypothetical protein
MVKIGFFKKQEQPPFFYFFLNSRQFFIFSAFGRKQCGQRASIPPLSLSWGKHSSANFTIEWKTFSEA